MSRRLSRSKRRIALLAAPVVIAGLAAPTLLGQAAQASTQRAAVFTGPRAEYIVEFDRAAATAKLASSLKAFGATKIDVLSALHAATLTLPKNEVAAVREVTGVKSVLANGVVPGPKVTKIVPAPAATTATKSAKTKSAAASPDATTTPAPTPNTKAPCGTAADPESDPEALTNINATPGETNDGSGVTVALLADGLDPYNLDLKRNKAYSTPSSEAGSLVVKDYSDFSGDGTSAPTDGGEAFLDAGSIAAQGNEEYDLSQFVSTKNPLPADCDITITGDAPGSSLIALKVFSENQDTTTSGFVQAIEYAVDHGSKVINESFGSNNFPDTTLDAIRDADDAAVAGGVTVVVSAGDAGTNSTIGSPASDPNVISVGATDTFRGYEQDTFGGVDAPGTTGKYIDNNISDLSSGGFTQSGNTVDLVAPGDSNWTLCQADLKQFADCSDENGNASNIALEGGTSESAPLTSGAAADVISAYSASHGGADPTPAVVKHILMSSAKDISAPADEQGAGLLDVAAAVKLAQSLPGTTSTTPSGVEVNTSQVNAIQQPGATVTKTVSLSNLGTAPSTVNLATRALTGAVSSDTGNFCLQPGTPTKACPANTGALTIWSGYTETYQTEPFTVPADASALGDRLNFTAAYPYVGQSSPVHIALIAPDNSYAAYSDPQGLADYADVDVSDPAPGIWHAIFFTVQDDSAGDVGSSGNIQWDATTQAYKAGATVTPATVAIPAGKTVTENVAVKAGSVPGDSDQSILVTSADGTTDTTIPLTERTLVPTTKSGGSFSGDLTGGNGRAGGPSQTSTYEFNVPKKTSSIHLKFALADDPEDQLFAYLVNPQGQTVGYSTNYTAENLGDQSSTTGIDLYHAQPEAGRWSVVFDFQNPVAGTELNEPFAAKINFNEKGLVSDTLPTSKKTLLTKGKSRNFTVTVNNNGVAPQAFFVDPRLSSKKTYTLADINGHQNNISLPIAAGFNFPLYAVPTHTNTLDAIASANVGVTFDLEYLPGDPDLTPAVITSPSETGGNDGDSAELVYKEGVVSPGLWLLNPAEFGPFPTTGTTPAKAYTRLKATTAAFDPTITSSTGDFWSAINGLSDPASFNPQYVPTGDSTKIKVHIKPTAKAGTVVHGVVYVDDYTLSDTTDYNADELQAIHYTYKVK